MRSTTLALPPMLLLAAMGCGPSAEDPAPSANESSAVADESVDARAECEQLLEAATAFAKELLAEHGEFLPYGSTLSSAGEIGANAGWTGDEHPEAGEVLELLEESFNAGALRGDYRATALVFNVAVTPPGKQAKQDAIAVALDHRAGDSRLVFFPYSFTPEGELVVEPAFELEGAHSVFAPREAAD
jgi:hypothetical protein